MKKDIIKAVSLETGIIQEDVDVVISSLTKLIRRYVKDGREVHLREFGVFKPRVRPTKIARNLGGKVKGRRKNPEPIILPACMVPHFKPSKKFLEAA